MKVFLSFLQVLAMATSSICCDCKIENFSWKRIGPDDRMGLNLTLNAYVTSNCKELVLNGTTGNVIGKINSIQVETEGIMAGLPILSFSDPKACTFKKPSSGESETSFATNMLPIFCTVLHNKNFEAVIPLGDSDKEAIEALGGSLDLIIRHKNINNVIGMSDFYAVKSQVNCVSEDY